MHVKIYQPAKTATQSGKKNHNWLFMLVADENHKSIDKIMGWTSSDDMSEQIRLKFKSAEEAANYAQKKGWDYQIIKPQVIKIVKKSYAENFL